MPMYRTALLAILGLVVSALSVLAQPPEISWAEMGKAESKVVGADLVVRLPASLIAQNGQKVIIRGYISPISLGAGASADTFLLTGTPGSCPFCIGAGPESFVLVTAASPLRVQLTKELTLEGRFEALTDDDTGFYYRLKDATSK